MVSVIVPVFNAEKTLPACVQSILDQTYRDYELILIDDGSKDRSGQICDELLEKCGMENIPCQVIHQENGGVSRARNCGIDHVNGCFFVCVDSDDVIEPCYLEDLVRAAEEHPELGHILCGFRCTSHVHDYILTDREPLSITDRRNYMRLYEKILIQSPCLALYRTDIVRKHQIKMHEGLSLAEDILFNLNYLDALDNSAIGVVNKTNYIYQNEDPNSLYRKYRQDLLSVTETVNQEISYYLRRWNVTERAAWRKYYGTVLFRYQSVLKNTFHRQNPMSLREKIAYNDMVLQRESFQDAILKATTSIPPVLRRAYESGDYRRVFAAECVQKAKRMAACVLKGK